MNLHNKVLKEDMQEIYISLVQGLRDFFGKQGFKTAVLGLSGGIDSSLTLKIAVDALGAEHVVGILMPELGLTSRESTDHAFGMANALGVPTFKVPINKFIDAYGDLPWADSADFADGIDNANKNVKARVRTNILYHFANSCNALVLGTSNLSETRLGYGTKYGDLAADVEVLGELFKTQIRALAAHLNLPDEIIDKAPTAELEKGQTDAEDLGADYAELDTILYFGEKALELGADPILVKRVFELEKKNRHKLSMPPIIRINDSI